MARSRLSAFDNRDDRTLIWTTLHHIKPEQRVCVLAAMAASVPGWFNRGLGVKAETWEKATWADRVYGASTNLTNEVWRDLWLLVSNYGLDPLVMANRIVEYARKPHTIPPKRFFFPKPKGVADGEGSQPG